MGDTENAPVVASKVNVVLIDRWRRPYLSAAFKIADFQPCRSVASIYSEGIGRNIDLVVGVCGHAEMFSSQICCPYTTAICSVYACEVVEVAKIEYWTQ